MKLPFESLNRELLIKREAETNPNHGSYPDKRTAEELIKTGIVIIDKPKGPTSHQVADYAKKILKLSKAGHTGTLDPGVSGVLPIALEDSTKVVQVLLPAGKEYVAVAHFHKEESEEVLRKSFNKFIGKITQLPPVKSAVKRQERERTIYYIEIIEIDGKDVLFKVGCQGGTYIRKLIHDIGKDIGGAHMAELIRTKAGPFTAEDMITLNELSDAFHYYNQGNDKYIRHCILPLESAIVHLPKIYVLDTSINTLSHGANLKMPGIAKLEPCIKKKDLVAILSLKGELVALGYSKENSNGLLKKAKGLAVTTFKIFMDSGIYPKPPRNE
ncbi:MAG: RNA-guided pseudouridylation complex pseudouridine synthase subunit Cbf5 [Nanoarchaeota archaeon]|nr:RNA-guided pseudouridylation complex pseudouridine synthase subunit Cbf5 [Nanoarchaeota archaeon]